jgi:hypothetical protein
MSGDTDAERFTIMTSNIGEALLRAIATAIWHGHSPRGELEYVRRDSLSEGSVLMVHDLIAWTAGDEASGDALKEWADKTDLLRWAVGAGAVA